MQGDYFAYNNQMFQQNGYTPYAYSSYGNTMMPTNRIIEKLKKNKHKSMSGPREFNEFGTHSTDESIHLIRSRKTGENAANRYEADQIMKKRSQSGTSIMKGMASQLPQPIRSHSDERSVSPSIESIDKQMKSRKAKRDKKKKNHYAQYEEDNFSFNDNRLIDSGYLIETQQAPQYQQAQQFYQPQQQYQCQPQQYQYPEQQPQPQQQQPQYYPQYQSSGYNTSSTGAPIDYYSQQPQANNQYNIAPSQSYYMQGDGYSSVQPYDPHTQSYAPSDQSMQGLPNGAKIVAEYFLGYLDDQQQQQQSQYPQVYQQYQPCIPCVPCEPIQQQVAQQQPDYSTTSSASLSSKEEVEIEIWEKNKKDKESKKEKKASIDKRKSFDDFKKLSDMIDALEKKLGNLKTHESDPIQPIFLMPKQAEQAQPKPIYVPRNIYVPVIRPVFVPRERIIVRPQIIHVARPVLVDRPVPIQQRPIVIERDRPVPVRVETIERTEPVNYGEESEPQPCKSEPGGIETTYHEFTQNNYPKKSASSAEFHTGSSNFTFADQLDFEENKRKQQVLDLLEEAERRKKTLESKSNDSFMQQHHEAAASGSQHFQYGSAHEKALEQMPYNSGYTLEVLDQRVSDKFEKIDQETIKARYGVDSFQYLPAGVESHRSTSALTNDYYQTSNQAPLRTSGGSFKSLASANEGISNSSSNLYGNYAASSGGGGGGAESSVYAQNYGNYSSNANVSSILTDLAKLAAGNH